MEKIKWLVISYNLPTEPSRHRVAIWRGLKKIGAVNIQQSMWILPDKDENYSSLQKLSQDIESNDGESLLMESVFFEESHEERVILLFNSMRDEEYLEFVRECDKYLKEIEKEIAKEKFTFSELEEEEAEFEKLLSWYKKIEARDIFHSSCKEEAVETMDKIKDAYENYSEMVYQKNVIG
ncbi:MAG TPA: Chromate resistance protein ChrB [Anaerovoracaceae bacterium]|nr:Chromate resistance protein ChrB [Anaerovoracaceae bacterium]